MNRARISALALVNWRGVFYERYLLDRHVTALEGMNGAGKTTVMIAAYVALLPDMSKLRFTNLGETAATGGDRGIWGRLGEEGRPSYTVLDIESGEGAETTRLLAGVRLVRLGEPTVEPTAFIVTGLPAEQRLSDILLVRELDGDHVPELDQLRSAVEAAGGTMTTFRAIKDYFAVLFEHGITPMRLTGDEERSKLNEMLRTSMTGGISRVLTSELRGFLLKEESGLGDTLTRMRSNLDACARTRSEVVGSRRLEREITGVYEAGLDMFGAAVHAARTAASEAEREVLVARPLVDDARRTHRELEDTLAQHDARTAALAAELAQARADHAAAIAEAETRTAALATAARLMTIDAELANHVASAVDARAVHTAATAQRTAARLERTRAHDAYDRAARGLADLQAGIDELVRRAHGHRQFVRRLDDARRLLARPMLAADDASEALAALERERTRLETEHARLARDGRDLAARRAEYAEALTALAILDPSAPSAPSARDESAHPRARAVLARLADRDTMRARIGELDRERVEASQLAARQLEARALAEGLGLGSRASVVDDLERTERALHELEQRTQTHRAATAARAQREQELRVRVTSLDEQIARWQVASNALRRLADAGTALTTRAEITVLRDQASAELHGLEDRMQRLEQQRQTLHERAALLEQSGSTVDAELLRLRDELGGELLASRYEDVDVAAASWIEAKLGPLATALIVDDLDAATTAVAASERHAPNVWLVRTGTELDVHLPDNLGELEVLSDVVSIEPYGARLTRRRPRPALGRRARERNVCELREAIARDGNELDELGTKIAKLVTWRRDLEALANEIDVLAAGDPRVEHGQLVGEIAALVDAAHDDLAATDRRAHAEMRTRLEQLRRLLPLASLLDEGDHGARAKHLLALRAELATPPADPAARATLTTLLEALRTPPPDDVALAAQHERARGLAAQLDALAIARAALDDVIMHRHAADFADADDALAARGQLATALEAQHASARAAVEMAAEQEALAEAAWEAATAALQHAEARRLAVLAQRDRVAVELANLGGTPSDPTVGDPAALAERAARLETQARELVADRAVTAERVMRATATIEHARARLAAAMQGAEPARAAWVDLRERTQGDGTLHVILAGAREGRTSVQFAADAWSKRDLLLDRVQHAHGGGELALVVNGATLDGPGYLTAWRATREWLRRRVPVQVADVDEPLVALERLRDHLDVLERRLARQEHDLRGASEDVARGIDVQVRRANGQVRRLNATLDGIAFGSIKGIRVEMRRIERMEQILSALRLGEAQELLFTPSIPIEEALDEIFRRYGGGGRGGGQRLLDYREYLELVVEIRRQASETWETASPTKLSTGEAIGVGAALMMVVLTEWERDANLLRARRTGGSLRFLFLDEANRLSRDNLGVLFDLCKTLDLQLLIAAPEVARAEGNTTYRLVRHVGDDGREEVIVSGRRSVDPV
ncbi:MAG: chromosome partition protein MukB [Kofleriaceae bacterium]